MWYCNSNSCVFVSVDGFLLHSKSRGMQWKGQLGAWQSTAYVILGKSFETLPRKAAGNTYSAWSPLTVQVKDYITGELSKSS